MAAVIDGMRQRRRGHLCFVSSTAGLLGVYGYTAYSPTKFALRALAEALRSEVAPDRIRVSVVYPPDTDTPGFALENEVKPPETAAISATVKPVQADRVAAAIVRGIERNRITITADPLTATLARRRAAGTGPPPHDGPPGPLRPDRSGARSRRSPGSRTTERGESREPGGVSVAESFEGAGSGLPVLVHLHEQLQVRAVGQLTSDSGADLLEHRAALADHHALLRPRARPGSRPGCAATRTGWCVAIECGSSSWVTARSCFADQLGHPEPLPRSVTSPSGYQRGRAA